MRLSHSLQTWADSGFHPHTVIPPGAFAPRLDDQDQRGKLPGVLSIEGNTSQWVPLQGWRNIRPGQIPYMQRSFEAGANVGVRTGEGLFVVDCDFDHAGESAAFRALVIEALGRGPTRVGRAPRWSMFYRFAGPIGSRSFRFGAQDDPARAGGVEFLGSGRQVVVQGVHPRTGQHFDWDDDPCAPNALPPVTAEQVTELVARLRPWALSRGLSVGVSNSAMAGQPLPDPSTLVWPGEDEASLAALDAMADTIPNLASYGWDDWVRFAHAFWAAYRNAPEMGLDAFIRFSERWQGGEIPTISAIEARWRSIRRPDRAGWRTLAAHADQHAVARAMFAMDEIGPLPSENPALDEEREMLALLDDEPSGVALPNVAPAAGGFNLDALRAVPPPVEAEHLDRAQQAFYALIRSQGFSAQPPRDGHLANSAIDFLTRRLRLTAPSRGNFARVLRSLAEDAVVFFWNGDWFKVAIERLSPALHLWAMEYADRFYSGESRALRQVRDTLKRSVPGDEGLRALRRLLPLEEVDTFDANPSILNTPGGVVDLTTGRLRDRTEADRVSYCTSFTPAAGPTPLFMTLLDSVTEGMPGGRAHVQMMCGSVLLGNPQQRFWMVVGPGGNGKSTLAKILLGLLNRNGVPGYARTAPVDLLTRTEAPRYVMATLKGARLIFFGEAPTGRSRLLSSRIKTLASHDSVVDRFPYAVHPVTFFLRGVPLVLANSTPRIDADGGDSGVRTRMEITAAPPEHGAQGRYRDGNADEGFPERVLREEGPAILAWMIEGALAVQRGGLNQQSVASTARRTLVFEALFQGDPVGAWVDYFLCAPSIGEDGTPSSPDAKLLTGAQIAELIVGWAEAHRPEDATTIAAEISDPARMGRTLASLSFRRRLMPVTRRAAYLVAPRLGRMLPDASEEVASGRALGLSAWTAVGSADGENNVVQLRRTQP